VTAGRPGAGGKPGAGGVAGPAAAGGAPLLAIRDLAIDFGTPEEPQPAVRGIDLTVTQGSTLGIVGESGSGKSMSMLSVVSLLPDTARVSGSVQLAGREALGLGPRELRKIRGSQVGMIFQDPMTSLNPVFTVGDQVGEAIRTHEPGMSRRKARARAIELLADVTIPRPAERARSYPFELSGGMRQRVMIAIAIANNPALLIADEPTTALDVTIQAQILELLKRLVDERNVGLIVISHDLGVVAGVVDRVAVMYGGRIVEDAPVDELFAAPRHPYTRALLGCTPRLDRPNAALTPIPGTPPVLSGLHGGCSFRARCGYRQPRCEHEDPVLQPVGRSQAACLFAGEIGAQPLTTAAPAATEEAAS
jgi:oligopeptide/dipeptide ABC transporter ATP-binding protein